MAAPRASARLSSPTVVLKAEGTGRCALLPAVGNGHRHGRRAGACARRPAGLKRALPDPVPAGPAFSFGFR